MSFSNLIHWSKKHYSNLPWRKNRSPYHTLVSEIMLQQTTVGTVLNHFERFIHQFPDLQTLAKASEHDILVAWKGLGYYRRAKNLRFAAQDLFTKFGDHIPQQREELISIKGIGDYTSSAILSLAYQKRELAVDANLERVISRLYGIQIPKGPKLIKEIRRQFESKEILKELTAKNAREMNEALMDLGRVYCQARKANCLNCPLSDQCVAYREERPLHYPVGSSEIKKNKESFQLVLVRVIVVKANKLLGYLKKPGEWLEGQFEVPTFILSSEDASCSQYPKFPFKKIAKEITIKTTITKYKIENIIIEMSLEEFEKVSASSNMKKRYQFISKNDQKNLSTASLKSLKKINSSLA